MNAVLDESKRPIAQISIDTRVLIDRLEKSAEGEVIPYDELNKLLGRDVRTVARHNVQSAMRHLESRGMVFSTIRTVGIKLLTDSERVGEGDTGINKVRRCARRAAKRLRFNKFEALSNEEKTRTLTAQSVLGAVTQFTKPTAVKRISESVETGVLPVGKTLQLFIGKE